MRARRPLATLISMFLRRLVLVAALPALFVAGAAQARPLTTKPTPVIDIRVTIGDQRLMLNPPGAPRPAADAGIGRGNVARLEPVWRYRFGIRPGESGAFTAAPVVAGGVVYLQDMDSNVIALDLDTGAQRWLHRFRAPSPGPNGVAVAGGRVFGAMDTTAFALS